MALKESKQRVRQYYWQYSLTVKYFHRRNIEQPQQPETEAATDVAVALGPILIESKRVFL